MEQISKIEWDDSYLIGIPEIDNQHKKLLSIANELYDASAGSDEEYKLKMSHVLKSLVDYTEYHFTQEEKFMDRYEYPSTCVHKMAHDSFITEVYQHIKKISSENRQDGLLLYSYMVNWVLTHIARADPVWASFVKQKLS